MITTEIVDSGPLRNACYKREDVIRFQRSLCYQVDETFQINIITINFSRVKITCDIKLLSIIILRKYKKQYKLILYQFFFQCLII